MAVLIIVLVMALIPIISVVCIVYDGKLKKYSPTKIILKALGGLIFFLSLYAIGGYFFFAGFRSIGKLNKHLDKIFEEEYSSIVFECCSQKSGHGGGEKVVSLRVYWSSP